jgi:hypothetical protein
VRLPHAESAVVGSRKLTTYLLSSEHPVGRFKAAFFFALGFTPQNWEKLELELRKLARWGTAEPSERNAFGQKYVVRGRITGPEGRSDMVTSVWIVLNSEEIPRFVTAYPGD